MTFFIILMKYIHILKTKLFFYKCTLSLRFVFTNVTRRTSVWHSFLLIILIFFLWKVQNLSLLFLSSSFHLFLEKIIFQISINFLFLFPSFFFIYTVNVKKKRKKMYFSGYFHNLSVSILASLYLFFFLSFCLSSIIFIFFSNVLMLWWIARNLRTEFAWQADPLHSLTHKYNW